MIVKTLILSFLVSMSLGYTVVMAPGEPQIRRPVPTRLSSRVEEPCEARIIPSHQPKFGHIWNGSRVEIQQDEENSFVVTFVECIAPSSPGDLNSCHGIDHSIFASQCVTVYEHRTAQVRLVNSFSDYFPADIRVPVYCECRLRRHVEKEHHPKLLERLANIL